MKDVDILICGASRCGKTTLSHMLAARLHYPVIHRDAMVGALASIYSIGKATDLFGAQVGVEGTALFIHRYLRNSKFYDGYDVRYILEGMDLYSCRRFFHPEKNIIYCLGITKITHGEFFDAIRKNDTPREYTSRLTNEKLQEYISEALSVSRENKAFCEKHNIPFIETSGDRPAILASLADEIAARIEEIDREDD